MPLGLGSQDAEGQWQFGELDDAGGLASDLLNLAQSRVSQRFAADRILLARHLCALSRSTTQTLTTTATPLGLDIEIADSSNMHNNTVNNSRIVAPAAGVYEFTAHVYSNNATGSTTIFARLNGSTSVPGSLFRAPGVSGVGVGIQTHFVVRLAVGDYVELMVRHSVNTGNIEGGTTSVDAPQVYAKMLGV